MHEYEVKRDKIVVVRRGRFVRKDNWSASWIWCEGESRPRNFYLYARKTFKLNAKPVRSGIRITADSKYKLFVNGTYVGRGPVRSLPGRQYFDTYDISDLLTKGNNVIAVLVHHIGQGTYSYIPGRAALIAEADIEFEDGSEKIITDDTWKVLRAEAWNDESARMSRRLGFQEVYDANLEPDKWTEVKFKDNKWQQATMLGKSPMRPFERLIERQIPQLDERVAHPTAIITINDCPPLPEGVTPSDMPHFMAVEALALLESGRVDKPERLIGDKDDATTIKIPSDKGVSIILDFGREVFGSIELAFTRSHGGIVDIGYSERLEDGWIRPDREDVRYSDRLILGKGKQVWSSFEPRGFRYVQLDFRNCPKPIALNHVWVRETVYPVEWKGSFESNDVLLNQIWKTAAETAHMCMQDTYIDSPWRERAQWWDNAYIASRTALYAFGDTALLAQGLRHLLASQERNGAVLALYPSATKHIFPDFGALWVMSAWDYFTATTDKRYLSDIYAAVTHWLGWIGKFTAADGLLNEVEGDLFIDWGEIDRRGEVVALNCLYIGALQIASRMALLLKKTHDAEKWEQKASGIRNFIAKNLWSPTKGLYADAIVNGKIEEHYSRQTNALAVLFSIPDHYQKAAVVRQLLDDKGLPEITTPYFTTFVVESLFESGYDTQAFDLIRRKWGAMISEGTSTFGEFFSSEGTGCQASSSSPTYLLQRYALGVALEGNKVRIEPQPGDLNWARGVVPTHAGPVSVDWQIGRHGLIMTIEVPQGISAVVVPPRGTNFNRVLMNNKDLWDYEVEIGPGVHHFRVLAQSPSKMHSRRVKPQVELAPEPHPIPPGRGDIEYVEQMIKILAELEQEAVLAAAAVAEQPEEESVERPEKRKRSRRRSRHKRNGQESEVAVEETGEPEESVVEVAAEAETSTEAAPVAATEKRSRRRRGRRPSRTSVSAEPTEAVESAEVAEVAEAVVAEPVEAPAEETQSTERKPRRRSRRTSSRRTANVEAETVQVAEEPTAQVEAPIAKETIEAPVEAHSEAPVEAAPAKHRRRRTTRSSTKSAKPVTESPVESAPAPELKTVEVVTESAPVEAPAEAEEAPKRRRTTTRRRPTTRKKPEESANAVEAAPSEPAAAVEPVAVVEPSAEESSSNGNGKQPAKRTRRPRKKPAQEESTPVEG